MKRTRTTVEVDKLRRRMNELLQMKHIPTEGKCSLCSFLEEVLMETGNYKGFGWNMPLESAKAVTPSDPQYYDRYYY